MKILHVITRSDLGGAQSVVINLANSMCTDHDVTVVAGENGPMWNALNIKVQKIKIDEIVREVSILKDVKVLWKLYNINKKLKPDVIHLHSSKIGILGRLAFPRNKTVYSIHGFDSVRVAYRKFLPLEKLLKNRCKAIVLASDYDKRNAIYEGITKNLYVVYNGVKHPEQIHSLTLDGIEKYEKTVMCIARISPQKRFEAFVSMAASLPKYAFVWIGADKKYEGLSDNVFCIQGLPDAKRYIQLADLFVLPTNYEGVPIVIIDALSYGKPVISSDVGGISEIVVNDENGYTVENSNDVFVAKIKYILENESVSEKFSKKSREVFENNLTVEKMVENYLIIYDL